MLAIPLFNSAQILSSIFLSEAYFDNFKEYTLYQGIIFLLGLIGIIVGIVFVTIGQNSVSMKNHNFDQMKYIATKQHIIDNGDEVSLHLRNISMIDMQKLNAIKRVSNNINETKNIDTNISINTNNNNNEMEYKSDSIHSLQIINDEKSDSDFDERATLL